MHVQIPIPLVLLLLELIPLSFAAEVDNAVNSLRVHPNPQAYTSQRDSGRNDKKLRVDTKPQCHPFGACEPCPKNLLHEPFCQPFGNRRLVHCLPTNSGGSEDDPSTVRPEDEVPAWESCGRIPSKERADFFEFVLCNIIFAAMAVSGVLIRSERMRVVRARRLAARIGVTLRRRASWAPGVGGTDEDGVGERLLRDRSAAG